ncbi:MAG TPA: DUF4199 domain-containing protein [Flavobacterium sp.]|uniref:DUF4199 domain-containing protein n=1 Tax=Flavobacterium sp. TaxID=239 RepID=UPI002B4AC8F3|nr:DUF4199 domain-containing protein [Flavobacterium sp.]HLO74722.1 DUF4199 domain-containing protein [Flavobacterium sp.]
MNEIIKKNGINFGIITGVISVLITSAIYIIDLELMTKWWLGLSILGLYIVIGCILLVKTKKALGGYMSFKEGFTTYFISAVIGIAISVIFNILLYNVIDPEAAIRLKELTLESTVEMMKKFGSPSAAIKETVEKMKDYNQFSAVEQLKGSIWSIVGSAIFGLILAAIFKRDKPVF